MGSTANMIVIKNAVWRFIGPSEVGPVYSSPVAVVLRVRFRIGAI
jgi:hypothetical protein